MNDKSEILALHVVFYRTFGINKDKAISSMKELCKRREEGDEFDFEEYISEKIKSLPVPKGNKVADTIKFINGMIIR